MSSPVNAILPCLKCAQTGDEHLYGEHQYDELGALLRCLSCDGWGYLGVCANGSVTVLHKADPIGA